MICHLWSFIFLFVYLNQGWEFAHLNSERITHFLSKNEWMSDSLQKMSDSLICSFLVSEMSDSLTSLISSEGPEQIAHGCSFLVSKMSDSLTLLIWFEQNERFTHILTKKEERGCSLYVIVYCDIKSRWKIWKIWVFIFTKTFFFFILMKPLDFVPNKK